MGRNKLQDADLGSYQQSALECERLNHSKSIGLEEARDHHYIGFTIEFIALRVSYRTAKFHICGITLAQDRADPFQIAFTARPGRSANDKADTVLQMALAAPSDKCFNERHQPLAWTDFRQETEGYSFLPRVAITPHLLRG